jgi:hypothetical protein
MESSRWHFGLHLGEISEQRRLILKLQWRMIGKTDSIVFLEDARSRVSSDSIINWLHHMPPQQFHGLHKQQGHIK